MNLHDPTFERKLRRRVHAELSAHPSLQSDYRRPPRLAGSYGWLWPFVIGLFMLSGLHSGKKPADLVLASAALFATGLVLMRARAFLTVLHASHDLAVLAHLPVADDDIFRLGCKKAVWGTLSAPIVFGLVGLAAADKAGLGPAGWAAAGGLVLLQWLVAVTMTAVAARWCPRWPHQAIGVVLMSTALLLFVTAEHLRGDLRTAAGWSLLTTPAGWVAYAFEAGVLRGHAVGLLAAMPAILLSATLPVFLSSLRRDYSIGEILFPEAPSAETILEAAVEREMVLRSEYDPDLVAAPETKPAVRDGLRQSIPAIMEERALRGEFLGGAEWTGFTERLFARWLTDRERPVAEFMLAGRRSWTRQFWITAAIATVGLAGGIFVKGVSGVAFLIVALMTAAVGDTGSKPTPSAGKLSPLFSVYPLGYWEISRVILKARLVRFLCWLPLLAALALVGGWRMGLGPWTGLVFGLEAVLLFVLLQPLFMALIFSGGTNDSERLTFVRFFFVILPAGAAAMAFVLAGVYFTFVRGGIWIGAGAAAIGLMSLGLWALYGVLYNRGRVDLLRTEQAS